MANGYAYLWPDLDLFDISKTLEGYHVEADDGHVRASECFPNKLGASTNAEEALARPSLLERMMAWNCRRSYHCDSCVYKGEPEFDGYGDNRTCDHPEAMNRVDIVSELVGFGCDNPLDVCALWEES